MADDESFGSETPLERLSHAVININSTLLLGISTLRDMERDQPNEQTRAMVQALSRLSLAWDEIQDNIERVLDGEGVALPHESRLN